ncbi:MAG: cache domain-containing protein, partial [Caldimonas sp.]
MTPRWRLFPKYALLIIALVGGLLIASGAISIYFSWLESRRNLVALQDEKAQAAATRIEQYILDIEHQLGWTALPTADTGASPLEQRRIDYLKLLRQVPAITEAAWIDASGHEQLRISRLAMDVVGGGDDLSQEPKFSAARGGPTFYGPVYFRKDTEPYMTISRPAGSGGGVTAVEVNLKFVWDVVSRIKIGEAGLAYVVDSTGTLIAHPDISLVLRKTDLKALPQVAKLSLPAGDSTVDARGLKGEKVLSAHAVIPPLRWTVFVESPEAEAFAPLQASIARAGLLLAAGLLVSMVASYLLARALVRPLRELQEGAARIGAGELDRRIDVRTGDELESLAEQFNKMAGDLKESYGGLERKVAERTAELTETLEQQTATADILHVISSSPTDVQPVFDAIAERAMMLCEARIGGVARFDGEWMHLVACHGVSAEAEEAMRSAFPMKLGRRAVMARAILERAPVQIADVLDDPEYELKNAARQAGFRANLAVPMMREGEVVGSIAVCRAEPGPFPERLVRLLQTFA